MAPDKTSRLSAIIQTTSPLKRSRLRLIEKTVPIFYFNVIFYKKPIFVFPKITPEHFFTCTITEANSTSIPICCIFSDQTAIQLDLKIAPAR